jgi:hypothetical protein
MAQDKAFLCGECAQQFIVAGSPYAHLDWVLRCPWCGSICVLLIADTALRAAAPGAA